MTARIKVTGYFTPEPEEAEEGATSGLTEEAYANLICDETGTALKVSDLEEVDVEVVA